MRGLCATGSYPDKAVTIISSMLCQIWPSYLQQQWPDAGRSPEEMSNPTSLADFGRLLVESNQAMQRKSDFSDPLVDVYGDKNDYAL